MSRAVATILIAISPLLLVELRRAIPALFGLEGSAPDPLLIGLAFAALRAGPLGACLFGAALGALEDVPSGTPFGLGAARLALGAALLSSLRSQVELDNWLARPVVVLMLALASKAAQAIVLEASGEVALLPVLGHGLVVALLTAAATPFFWPACEALQIAASDPREHARLSYPTLPARQA